MEIKSYKTPVLFLIFNRPKETAIVFDEIKKVKPKKLFVAADGPRNGRNEEELCKETRDIIKIDWDCELKTLYREENLGVAKAVKEAIDWFFLFNSEGIILEDDCLPDSTFFNFSATSLEAFKNNKDVFMISGTNFLYRDNWGQKKNYFTRYCGIWGWATWRDRWNDYIFDVQEIPTEKLDTIFQSNEFNKNAQKYWQNIYDGLIEKRINSWGYQMNFSMWHKQSYCVCPSKNLILNLGLNMEGTHDFLNDPYRDNMPKESLLNITVDGLQQITTNELSAIDNKIFKNYYSYSISRILRILGSNKIGALLRYALKKITK